MAKETFVVNGMTCASCVANVENAVNKLDGVDKAVVNLTTEKMSVDYAGDKVSPEAIEKAVADAGYEVEVYNPDTAKSQEERESCLLHVLPGFWLCLDCRLQPHNRHQPRPFQ